jgi:type I restriction enzyme S subunit
MKQGWVVKKLSEICEIQPNRSEVRRMRCASDMASFLPMEDLKIGEKFISAVKERTIDDVIKSYTYFAENDVLLAKITPCFENGKLGIVKNLINRVGFGSSEYIVFRTKDSLYNEYLYYYLSREQFRKEGKTRMSGAVGHKRISKDFIEKYEIPIPSLSEQKRIVAILDEAFAAIDKAKNNAEKNLQNSKELFESYLQSVFNAIKTNCSEQKLNDISENLDFKRIPITKNVRINGQYPYYGASGIVDYVSDYIFDGNFLLISEDGANLLARTYPIAFSISGKFWVNNHAHILKFENLINQRFVEYYFNSIKLDDYVSGMAQPKLNQTKLNSIPIPYPQLEKQNQLVNKFDSLNIEKNRLAAIYQKKLDDLDELKKSILQKAFNGELKTIENMVSA